MSECEFCGYELPGGCHGMYSVAKECRAKASETVEWKIGRAIWDDLCDRRGVKNELRDCDPEIQAEIVNTMGKIAVKVMQKHQPKEKK